MSVSQPKKVCLLSSHVFRKLFKACLYWQYIWRTTPSTDGIALIIIRDQLFGKESVSADLTTAHNCLFLCIPQTDSDYLPVLSHYLTLATNFALAKNGGLKVIAYCLPMYALFALFPSNTGITLRHSHSYGLHFSPSLSLLEWMIDSLPSTELSPRSQCVFILITSLYSKRGFITSDAFYRLKNW